MLARAAAPRRSLSLPLGEAARSSLSATALTSTAARLRLWCKAALGGEMEIPTIDGDRAKITIPAAHKPAVASASKAKA
jgi:hypothetical protein